MSPQVLRPAERVHERPAALAGFPADYWDAFRTADVDGTRPADWAARALGGAEAAQRAFPRLVWGFAMGFELAARGTARTLVGWRVTTDTDESFVLETDGSRFVGRMVFAREDSSVVWTTMLQYRSGNAAKIWAALAPVHRAVAPQSLSQARRALVQRA